MQQETEGLIAVHLHQPLSEEFGDLHHFNIRTPFEALHALDANYPKFRREFAKHPAYWIVVDGELKTYEDFRDQTAKLPVKHEVHFVPKVTGNQFLGVALVGAIFPAIAGTVTAQILGGLLMAGLFLGLSMLLAPKKASEKDTEKDQNYAFSGPENVTQQGVAVPLLYGRCHCGSVVVSASLMLGTDLSPDVPPPPPAAVADYPTNATPGLTPPPGGWPAIEKNLFKPLNYDHGSISRVGPKGWEYMGVVGKMIVVNGKAQKADVEYFRSPRQVWPGAPVTYYAWDRLTGFQQWNARLLNW
ncbi:MAG TPA: hypothetical protein VK602_12625 [Phyllobacterium sp.]|nr:hypothetical protein [Phyllobacterium sp.]